MAKRARRKNTLGKPTYLELKIRARGMYLTGLSPAEILTHVPVGKTTLSDWITEGKWVEQREAALRYVEHTQAVRVRRELARGFSRVAGRFRQVEEFLFQFMQQPVLDGAGQPVAVDGLVQYEMRAPDPGFDVTSPTDLARTATVLLQAQTKFLEAASSQIGERLPKSSPEELNL